MMRSVSRFWSLVACTFASFVGVASLAVAEDDKNGVSPTTISRPSGPGSLEGLGDAFQPALNTGMARYTIRFQLPAGVAGFTPEVALTYDSGMGFGSAGIGWSFGPGGIRRQTDKGLPRYTDAADPPFGPDRYLGMGGEELVPLQNGHHLAKIEGAFVRCRRVGDAWEAHTKGGTKLEFGLTPTGRLTDPTGTKIYEWRLERRTDTNGNVIRYHYVRPSEVDRQVYLSEIRYGPGPEPWTHAYAVRFVYEDRADTRTDYRSGFRVRTTERLRTVEVLFDEELIRRYELLYEADPHRSLLTSVTQRGDDGVSVLPATTFEYATFTPPDPGVPISAFGHVIGSMGEPAAVVDNAKSDLLDVNADGLPDLLVTDAGHLAYLNRGVRADGLGGMGVQWEGPAAIGSAEPRAFDRELSAGNVHLADMNGDGLSDLVVTEESFVEYFPNSGAQSWSASTFMSVEQTPPPAPFGTEGALVRTTDLDFDKRMDVIKSDFGIYSVWFNLGGGSYSAEMIVDGAYYNGQFVDFADPGVDFADMNGDRLNDLVKITPISVVYFPSMGYGKFDEGIELLLPDRFLDDTAGGNLERAKLTDINSDGLADLVVERADGNNLWYWINMGNETLALSRVVTDLPATANAAVRWADINGNGTTDLIYADSTLQSSRIQAVDLAELVTGSAHFNALTAIDNGYGRKTTIEYRSSTDFFLDAFDAQNPWSTTVPFPVEVVSRTSTSIGLDLDGYPDEGADGDVYITDYVYRDGYYDPLEKQFRGFAFVKELRRGDERFGGDRAPTLVTRFGFHTGAPDVVDNDQDGMTDEFDPWDGREEEPLKGVELWQEATSLPDDPLADGGFAPDEVVFDRTDTTWEVRNLCTETGGPLAELVGAGYVTADHYARVVRFAFPTRTLRTVIERQADAGLHKQIETRTEFDALGNRTVEWQLGDVSNPDDDLHTTYEYALAEAPWLVGLTSRITERADSAAGPFISQTRNYYDGDPFVGLPLGQVGARGNLHRTEEVITLDPVPAITERSLLRGDPRDPDGRIDSLRQKLDVYGNPIVVLDPEAGLGPDGEPDGSGHERRIEYDALLHRFPVRETIVLGSARPALEVTADYHFGFGKPTSVSDFNGNVTRYVYDTFGRLHQEFLPGDAAGAPTRSYEYDLGSPVSSIATTASTAEGESSAIVTRRFFDGLGRGLGKFEEGGPAMSDVTLYNPRGTAWKTYQPYFGAPTDKNGKWSLPDPATPATHMTYDAMGRAIETVSPPDSDGVTAVARTDYLPLRRVEYDGEDTTASSPHFNTPKTSIYDGLDRLSEVHEIENLSQADSGTFITRYRYALPDLLAEIKDAKGNVKYIRYDGLGRKIFSNDCNRGQMTYTYDAAGNVLETVDAKGQEIRYTYDGANRILSEDYLDGGTPLSGERTPDVVYHYDAASAEYPFLSNTRGRIAFVEDLTGAEFRGYNVRGALESAIKRVEDADRSHRDWTITTLMDSLDRPYQTVYPDENIVRNTYDARGLVSAVGGFMEEMTYRASSQRAQCTFANGVVTNYEYDPRLRLTRILTESNGETLQDLSYTFDQADNVRSVTDGRTLPPGDPRNQTASFIVDNCYRLARAVGESYGTIDYDYDRLGNMVTKTSPDIADPDVDLGQMASGGAMGTFNRIGRAPSDPPGPHALTTITNGQTNRTLTYDANGNLTGFDKDQYLFDFKDRLGRVVKEERDISYLYDWTDRRVIKRVDGAQTTYISKLAEVRDGEMIDYVFAGRTRIAQVRGSAAAPNVVSQRMHLGSGWNLISFQVDSAVTDPAVLLADIDGKYSAVYGYDGTSYLRYIPGAGDNTLAQLHPGEGYWVLMAEPGELLLEGTLVQGNATAFVGEAALVGLIGMKSVTPDEYVQQHPDVRAIHAYFGDGIGWRSWRASAPEYLNTLKTLMPGRGYWIATTDAFSLTGPSGASASSVFYHPDHLGSTNILTGDPGSLLAENVYYPFGALRRQAGEEAAVNPFYGFSDKERDAESSLLYFEARYCTSALGRFTSVDPKISAAPMRYRDKPQWLNLYAYAANNPLRYVDPDGQDPKEAVSFTTKISDVVGAAAAAITAPVTQASPLLVPVAPDLGVVSKVARSPALKVVGGVLGVIGIGMAADEAVEGVQEGESDKVVGGIADAAANVVGLVGGTYGAIGAGGYAVGSVGAEQIDKHTGWYDQAAAHGRATEQVVSDITGNETVGTVAGAVIAGAQSINPVRFLWDPDVDSD